jgi:hypothetical protein
MNLDFTSGSASPSTTCDVKQPVNLDVLRIVGAPDQSYFPLPLTKIPVNHFSNIKILGFKNLSQCAKMHEYNLTIPNCMLSL